MNIHMSRSKRTLKYHDPGLLDFFESCKHYFLGFGGALVTFFFERKPGDPINWFRIIAVMIFMVFAIYISRSYFGPQSLASTVVSFLCGFYCNRIISLLFRWFKVNEEAIMERTKRFWNKQ